ncbi:MAG: AAA family ATPase [Oscillospiraceae bacterium]|nr:AAA family ATPase [Oscillospiraceae bacterium]
MTEIKIKRLSLENFKCHKALTLDFNGGNASIYGRNHSGKSSVYDALTWLLFNKSSLGSGDSEFTKPLGVDGEVLNHDALTSVEAVLLVNGEELSLQKTLKEIWTTKRGDSKATYSGNTSEYFINGVPMKANAFQDRVRALVDEEAFVMLTSLGYFASKLGWRQRREVLFRLAGVNDDRMILATDEQFKPILEAMGNLSIEDLKKKLLAEKKAFSESDKTLPARISEDEKTVADFAAHDFEGARTRRAVMEAQMEQLSQQIMGLDQNSRVQEIALKIRELMLDRDSLDRENELYRKNQLTGTVDVLGLNLRMNSLNNRLVNKNNAMQMELRYIASSNEKIAEHRNQWIAVNGESYNGSELCPTCGQSLPALQLQVAKDSWAEGKKARLDQIKKSADALKESVALAEERYEATKQEVHDMEQELEQLRQQIAQAEQSRVEPVDMEGYAERRAALTEQINGLNSEQFDLNNSTATVRRKLEDELRECKAQIREADEILAKESVLAYTKKRIETLRADARKAAEQLDRVVKLLYLMEVYSRYKTTFVEDAVNDLFRATRFRLHRVQANGGIEDRCDVVKRENGVPYDYASTSEKVNMGLDIINTLSAAYGVSVPLFIDNAESVTDLQQCHSQRIRLVVSEMDKELRVVYET